MTRVLSLVAAFTVGLSGASIAQDVDPVGTWDFEVDFQGQAIAGFFEIAGPTGEWTGSAYSDALGTTALEAVEVDGNVITLTIADGGQGLIIIEMIVDGDVFTGVGSLGFDDFILSGSRRIG